MRKEIIDAVRDDLATVTTENGYTHTIEKIHKKLLNQKDVRDFPSVYVQAFPGKGVNRGDHYFWTFPLGIFLYLQVPRDVDAEGLLEKISEEVIEDQLVLWNNYGNLAALPGIDSIEITTIEPYIDTDQRQGIVFFTLKVEYIN